MKKEDNSKNSILSTNSKAHHCVVTAADIVSIVTAADIVSIVTAAVIVSIVTAAVIVSIVSAVRYSMYSTCGEV